MKKQRFKRSKRFFGSIFSSVFNFRLWLSLDYLKQNTAALKEQASHVFVPKVGNVHEDFDNVMQRFKLTEAQLKSRAQGLLLLSILMILLALAILVYSIYQFFVGTIFTGLTSIVFVVLALTLAFRYHFWYFQIKQRKLGGTWKDWLNYLLQKGE